LIGRQSARGTGTGIEEVLFGSSLNSMVGIKYQLKMWERLCSHRRVYGLCGRQAEKERSYSIRILKCSWVPHPEGGARKEAEEMLAGWDGPLGWEQEARQRETRQRVSSRRVQLVSQPRVAPRRGASL